MKKGYKNPDKYTSTGNTLLSQLEASKLYDEKHYKLVVRLPLSYKDAIRAYLNQYNKTHGTKLTINSWVRAMIENELFN